MARRNSFTKWAKEMEREAEKRRRERLKAQSKAAKEQEKAEKEYLRAMAQADKVADRERKEQQKLQQQLYLEMRSKTVDLQNEELEQVVQRFTSLLKETLFKDDYIDLDKLKRTIELPTHPSRSPLPQKPELSAYLPPQLKGMQKFVPGATKKQQIHEEAAQTRFRAALKQYETALQKHEQAQKAYNTYLSQTKPEIEAHNAHLDELKKDLATGLPSAIVDYCALVLEASTYPQEFPQHAKLAYVPESKQLVVEYDLPNFEVIPTISVYKYNKSKDEITTTSRPTTQRKALYSSVIAQITLRTIHELFEADRIGHIETIVFNGYVESLDRGIGHNVRICLVTVRTDRETFAKINLEHVDPSICLKTLNASVSKSPDELAPVRPVLEFSMVDPRFIEETDVLSSLDQRPNLMELTPGEFESLITNLFQKMGLDSKLTQASRDGGVDCVAYDPRPIFGGKVVIQAKRYKHTVGVSAVRDLFGTVQNEGASKGILVATSGYGKAAYQFAEGKPLELLSGSNLLYLLEEHAGIRAKIEVPSDWKEPQHDIEIDD